MFEYLPMSLYIVIAAITTLIGFWCLFRSIRYKVPFIGIAFWFFGVLIGVSAIAQKILNLYQHKYAQTAEFVVMGSTVMFLMFGFIMAFKQANKNNDEKYKKRLKWFLAYIVLLFGISFYIIFFY